ncbi:(2E,6E)-farnesyl diphosphate synthase [Pseudoalteromonas phenolica]|uniref:Geranyltranstransferase n=1 Tax=Pseudoalteromonas phenolica TaxID=161398 RepID=A0A0S2K4A4_9GAMM|nr:farnesyl diphosphate synthase [Pseudoalteromonas phenolica]ALO43163.1 Geranyltranstransferase [Pseudoalteromonas phenolica]MBE0355685.1 farnesyl diphosphate synthase [Pseudoalteromonas phenolica O-BC30]TMO56234.1 (2E,6E)-farnesyl diphosphate synthase [Pseudoalteromonas phenolica]
MNILEHISTAQNRLDSYISNYFSIPLDTDDTVKSATFYSINNGGKRLRPFLVYTVGKLLGAKESDLDVAAAAIECIHSYSLVHDDLPAMDDDDLRRGKPTCHIAYDEAQAILAGDALQTLAFEFLSVHEFSVPAKQQIKMINALAVASGLQGMVGGQALDIAATDKSITLIELERIHRLKTGALLKCAIQLGALCAPDVEESIIAALEKYGRNLGLAFQVQDDILDIEGDTAVLGKPQGSDLDNHKSTYPALLGLNGAKQKAHQLVADALLALDEIPHNTDVLAELAKYIIERDH